jgi:hypothetical protein
MTNGRILGAYSSVGENILWRIKALQVIAAEVHCLTTIFPYGVSPTRDPDFQSN